MGCEPITDVPLTKQVLRPFDVDVAGEQHGDPAARQPQNNRVAIDRVRVIVEPTKGDTVVVLLQTRAKHRKFDR